MSRLRIGSGFISWLPVLFLALGPTASAVDDESPAAPPSNAASLIPANTPPTLKALGGEGTVSATSKDSGIATVSVSGAEIVVSGVSAGSTEILVKLAESEFRMPVQVGGGG